MTRMGRWATTLLLAILSFSLFAQDSDDNEATGEDSSAATEEVQEIKYVTDKLRLSLYKRANSGSGTLKLLTSGDKLAVLERSGPYSRVRTEDGLSGWVKNGFLLSEPTDSFRLIEEQEKNRILAQQIEKYADARNLVTDYENTIQKMTQDSENLSAELVQLKQDMEQLREQNQSLSAQIEAVQQEGISWIDVQKVLMQLWYFLAAGLLLMLLIGFIAGREVVEARIRRKFQGVKVW